MGIFGTLISTAFNPLSSTITVPTTSSIADELDLTEGQATTLMAAGAVSSYAIEHSDFNVNAISAKTTILYTQSLSDSELIDAIEKLDSFTISSDEDSIDSQKVYKKKL